MTKPGRIPCEGIGCRRTASAEKFGVGTKIICGKCWRLAPKAMRVEIGIYRRTLERLDQKIVFWGPDNLPSFVDRDDLPAYLTARERFDVLWNQILEAIQQARTGI